MPDNLRVGDKVKTSWGGVYTVASFTPIGDVYIGEVPGIFSPDALTLVTPKWEVGDRGIYPNGLIEFTVLDFTSAGQLITDHVMEGCGAQYFGADTCTRTAIATNETRQAAFDFYRQYWLGNTAAYGDGTRTFVVSSIVWIRDVATLQDKHGDGYPARECTRVDKPESEKWREHFQQISNAQQAKQIIGTRQVRFIKGGTTLVGQCTVSVHPLPEVNRAVDISALGTIRADELRQLAAILNEVADVLDS